MELPQKFDCQACGACCHGLDVLLGEQETDEFLANPKLAPLTMMHRLSNGMELYFVRRDKERDRCVALAGEIGKCRCTIYDRRPHLCRELQPGDPHCLESRRNKGFKDD